MSNPIITDVTDDPALVGHEGHLYPGTLDQLVEYDNRVLRMSAAALASKSVYEIAAEIMRFTKAHKEEE
jgi:hypothetical protein